MDEHFIRFDEYLNNYLYGDNGYYTSYETGKDYSTLVEVSQAFLEFLSAQVKQLIIKNNFHDSCIVDLGAGSGRLSASLASLNNYPVFAVEISESRRKSIKEKFSSLKNLNVVTSISEIENFSTAIIIAHEFFDALPVRIFKKEESKIRELYIHLRDLSLEYFKSDNIPKFVQKFASFVPEGTVFEYSDRYQETVKKIADFERAVVIIIDYGFTLSEIDRVKSGTLRGFSNNYLIEDIKTLISGSNKIDITHSVNFTILSWIFKSYGFEKKLFLSLGRFVIECLLKQREMMNSENMTELLKTLLPHRFGDSFYTAIYTKNAVI